MSLDIAIVGAGAIGGYLGVKLALSGCRVTFIARGENLKALKAQGMTLITEDGSRLEARDVAGSLLVTEVYTPQGNWSSYPSHRHDEDDFPRMTYLEETYYMRLNPAQGFGIQRVYTEDGSLDETMAVKNHDVTLVPNGHHPCGTPYGYEMYYLNVMAGPRRNWRFENDPDHDWIYRRDNPAA